MHGSEPPVVQIGQQLWLRTGWKIIPTRISFCSNINYSVVSGLRITTSIKRACNLTRTDAVLRSGHTPLLKACTHLLDLAADPTCLLCKKEPQTLEHWLQRCPNLDVLRLHTFKSPSPPLGVLTTDPEKVLALARATF